MSKLYIIIRLRSCIGKNKKYKKILEYFNLRRINSCSIHTSTAGFQKIKDFVTWGNISTENLKRVLNRTKKYRSLNTAAKTTILENIYTTPLIIKNYGLKNMFRLAPPIKGHKPIKYSFANKGALGCRDEKINELVSRMV